MRAVIQRVLRGSVTLEPGTTKERKVAEIENGVVILLGVGQEDGPDDACYLARKVAQLRIFEDTEGKLNLSLLETKGAALVVSQFTLYGEDVYKRQHGYREQSNENRAKWKILGSNLWQYHCFLGW